MLKLLNAVLISVLLYPTSAYAFTVSKSIRVPDWMDFYLFILALGVVLSFAFIKITKPAYIPMNEVYLHAASLSPATNFARFFAVTCIALFWVGFFIGMGLVRMA